MRGPASGGGSSSIGNPSSRVGHGSGGGSGGNSNTTTVTTYISQSILTTRTQRPTMMTPTLNNPPAYAPFLSPLPPPEWC
ncbi:hypothetical protein PM082_000664 [Marasmius tenuissimus]|nr:hypothetical protein PM082_000664 [Marasmius tenuissimus]